MNMLENSSSTLGRAALSLKNKGLRNSFLSIVTVIHDHLYDWKYQTDTCSWVSLDKMGVDENPKAHARTYQPTRVIPLRRLLRRLEISPGETLVDLGSGKGRVLLVASEFHCKKVRGVEFSSMLCEVAERNIHTYKAKKKVTTEFEVIHADATRYQFNDDETIFFLFNPFDEHILNPVVKQIADSLKRKNRKIWIIYGSATCREVFENHLQINSMTDLHIWGYDFIIYTIEPPM